MMRLLLTLLFSLFLFNVGGTALLAGEKDLTKIEPALEDILNAEDVLNQNDIKSYLTNYELIVKTKSNKSNLPELLLKTGWTENRLVYVLLRLSLGLEMVVDSENTKWLTLHQAYKPKNEELELIEKNKEALLKALNTVVKLEND